MQHVSVILPVYNEYENIERVYLELAAVLTAWEGKTDIVFVDDASSDGTTDLLRAITQSDECVRSFVLSENSKRVGAVRVGCHEAKGDTLVIMDADCQDNPQDIPKLLLALEDGADAVWGWRWQRQNSVSKRLSSWAINALANKMLDSHFRDTNASLRVIRREALESVSLDRGMVRFLPHQLFRKGYEVLEVPVDHRERFSGRSSFGVFNRISTIGDLIAIYRDQIPSASRVPSYCELRG